MHKEYQNPFILHEAVRNYSLCGVPGICNSEAMKNCRSISLRECSSCGQFSGTIFALLVTFMAVLILFGNGLVIASVFCISKNARSRLLYTKCSLAIADLMSGFQILTVTIPNFSWTMDLTARKLEEIHLLLRGSHKAVMGGFFFTLIYTSSLYHLLLISIQRFVAIKWPIFYKNSDTRRTFFAIAAVWLLSIFVASAPGWLPSCFVYTYVINTFLFTPSFTSEFKLQSRGKALLSLCFALPYLTMTGLTFATGFIVWKALKTTRKLSISSRMHMSNLHRQYNVIKTLLCMELGFTVTLLPNAVVVLLYYYEVLDCDTISLPLLVTFYISTSNSLVNVIIYSFQDETFKNAMKKLFEKILPSSPCPTTRAITEQKKNSDCWNVKKKDRCSCDGFNLNKSSTPIELKHVSIFFLNTESQSNDL